MEAASLLGNIEEKNIRQVVRFGIEVCYENGELNSMKEIDSALSKCKNINKREFLFSLLKNENKGLDEFIIKYMLDSDASITESENNVLSFCKKLKDENLNYLQSLVLKKRAASLNKPAEIEAFFTTLQDVSWSVIGDKALTEIFTAIGAKHGADTLIEYVLKLKPGKEYEFVFKALINSPEGYFSGYIKELVSSAIKNKDKWNIFLTYASNSKNEKLSVIIIEVLASTKQNVKSLGALGSLLDERNSRNYFEEITGRALEIILSRKQKSGIFSKLFGGEIEK
jgi:hypothetical protein